MTDGVSWANSSPADQVVDSTQPVFSSTTGAHSDGNADEEMVATERDLAEDAQWKRIQQNTFTRWANEHLKTVDKYIANLESDLSDGLKLIALIEVLSGKKLPKHNKRPSFRSQKLENVSVALKFLEHEEGIRIVNIGKYSRNSCVHSLVRLAIPTFRLRRKTLEFIPQITTNASLSVKFQQKKGKDSKEWVVFSRYSPSGISPAIRDQSFRRTFPKQRIQCCFLSLKLSHLLALDFELIHFTCHLL